MRELDGHCGAVFDALFDESGVCLLLIVVPQPQIAAPYPASRLGRRSLGDDEPDASQRTSGVMQAVKAPRSAVFILGLIHAHRRHDDAVFDL